MGVQTRTDSENMNIDYILLYSMGMSQHVMQYLNLEDFNQKNELSQCLDAWDMHKQNLLKFKQTLG